MEAPLHPKESARLAALARKNVLDTDPQPEFDDIVSLAAQICDAPVALISLVASDRQWFKAEVGMGVRQTPRSQSICAHVVYAEKYVEISDTLNDERTRDNVLCVSGPELRFYAGMPLMSSDGLPLGTLCVLDYEPRTLSPLQRETLRVLSRQVAQLMQLDMALRAEEVLRGEMDHRVKNSLQTVLSVLRLYKGRVKDEQAKIAFDAVQRRIEAIAALHEALYRASKGHTVRLDAYLKQIVKLLQDNTPSNLKIELKCPAMHVGSNEATSLAIVASEFAANSIKHGFPKHRAGTISLEVSETGDGGLLLSCADNGVGTGARRDDASGVSQSLGLKLMEAAAMQIGAQIERFADDRGYRLLMAAPAGTVVGR